MDIKEETIVREAEQETTPKKTARKASGKKTAPGKATRKKAASGAPEAAEAPAGQQKKAKKTAPVEAPAPKAADPEVPAAAQEPAGEETYTRQEKKLRDEIVLIANYRNKSLKPMKQKPEDDLEEDVNGTMQAYRKEPGADPLNFGDFRRFPRRQGGKYRVVKMYDEFSSEELLSRYLKRALDRAAFVTYPNRNAYMRSLFNTMYAVKDMSDYTIFKFDFRDFFNSVSSIYVYEKYLKSLGLERFQDRLLQQYVRQTRYAYAGLSPSNLICEVAARDFDAKLTQSAAAKGMILYRRYVDDGVLIFNRYLSRSDCEGLVEDALEQVFHDEAIHDRAEKERAAKRKADATTEEPEMPRCKTALSQKKTKYIARREMTDENVAAVFDFLGYQFELYPFPDKKKIKTKIRYGITASKIEKYTDRIRKIVRNYAEVRQKHMHESESLQKKLMVQDLMLLRHQIKAFTHRVVYQVERTEGLTWISKGFVSNYCELRYHLEDLTDETADFLKNGIRKVFVEQGVPIPYFLKEKDTKSGFSLYNNLERYRTLLFVEMIGLKYWTVKKMCREAGVDTRDVGTYDGLVRKYLFKVGVGY